MRLQDKFFHKEKSGIYLEELKKQKTWLTWNFKVTKDGKVTKVPKSPEGKATGTDEKFKHTWTDFETALNSPNDGVGLKIPKGMFLLDLDHKACDDPLVAELIKEFDSYTEVSPSGNGVHILGTYDVAKLPDKDTFVKEYYQKNSKKGMEIYLGDYTNRYATFTSASINSGDFIADCTNVLLKTLDKHMKRSTYVEPNHVTVTINPVQDENTETVIKRILRTEQDDRFSSLFLDGNVARYGSRSEADLALCSIIAKYVDCNEDAVDEIFRQSAICRDKWNRKDYRENTIHRATKKR